jgi:hypothetical protein
LKFNKGFAIMKINRLLALAVVPMLIAGCGGTGGGSTGGGSSISNVKATYRSDFLRGAATDTSVVVFVDNNNNAGAVISDSNGALYSGTGGVTSGVMNIVAAGVTSGTLGHSVRLFGTVSGATIGVTLTGDLTDSLTLDQTAGAGVILPAGTYNGTYTGSESGTFTMQISSTGAITGTLDSPSLGNSLALSGTLHLNGAIVLNFASGTSSATLSGVIGSKPGSTKFVVRNGLWSVNSMSGTWEMDQE